MKKSSRRPPNIDLSDDEGGDISLPFKGGMENARSSKGMYANGLPQEHESPTNAMSNMILAAPSAGPTTRQQSNKKRSLIKDTSKSKYVKKAFGDSPSNATQHNHGFNETKVQTFSPVGESPEQFKFKGGSSSKEPRARNYPSQDLDIDISDLRTFLATPLPKGVTLFCYVQRVKSGMFNKFPAWHLFVDGEAHPEYADKFLAAAKRKMTSKTSNYIISLDPDRFDKGPKLVGKVRGNFLGTEYSVFDGRLNPKYTKTDDPRSELMAITFESNVLKGGPRNLSCIIPPENTGLAYKDLVKTKASIRGGADPAGFRIFVNKKPKRNDAKGCFELGFNKRVKMASTKNFQLEPEISTSKKPPVVLQFGKVDDKRFNLDVNYPLSPLQAFGLIIAQSDIKLSVE
mmetsp:Transcript_38195/g.75174  ORF Transcript_38195/g.75174 Transcript_38195/m.75174 type:complete len:401 (+) Transcript_38195:34-1236(+)|eukprot:CAMPEP_0175140682 /NCGR_PEP_ID=MMETSP0087-20121206/11658_1 /TAXON_ID=136419 /ORGANISM="Unknown Unknown, Strain D1" /LENGTH=400 /DNA_ID=CAMNT_0016423959 /DNA_START=29 /DNA_END=1231 /DNA_ORIENTATION=+